MQVGLFKTIWKGDENETVPTLPDLGSNFETSDMTSAGFTEIPFTIGEKGIKIELAKEDITNIKAPLRSIKDKSYDWSNGAIDRIHFKSYEVGQEVYDFATNYSSGTKQSSHTRCSILLEIDGTMCLEFPSCEIVVFDPVIPSEKEPAYQEGYINVFGKDSTGTDTGTDGDGVNRHFYEVATPAP